MRKKGKRILTLLLALLLLISAMPVYAAATGSEMFSDVPVGAWYEKYLDKIIWAQEMVGQKNIISGYPDGSFKPNDPVKRGEWLKMLFEAAESSGNQTAIVTASEIKGGHWARKYYLKAQKDNILVADVYYSTENKENEKYTDHILFTDAYAELEKPITRYEMAVILNNYCTNIAMQKTVVISDAAQHIPDYDEIPSDYVNAVEQMYGKGLLVGYAEDSCFHGDYTLTRAQAATVLYKCLFVDTINGKGLQDWAAYPKVEAAAASGKYSDPSLSFAHWLQQGHINGYGNLDAEAKIKLFGSSSKSYFYSSADAAPYMQTVSVPIWVLNKDGSKSSSTCAITVHYLVADEVKSIFQMIYDDPEQFPIYGGWSAGGARYTDTMRHSWGCAIDVNAYYNCECDFRGYGGSLRVTCGYGWWPIGHNDTTYIGSMSGPSAYSIGSKEGEYGYSVVKAFKTYGWGWGGQGYSSGKHDFMHFSVMPSGG